MLPPVSWSDEVMAWSIFSSLQNCLNLSDMKFMPASDTMFSSPNSVNTNLACLIRASADRPSAFFMMGN